MMAIVRLPEASPSAIGLLRILLAASLLVPLLLFAVASWLDYRHTVAEAGRDLLRSSEVAREHAAKVFDAQSQVVDRVNDLVRGMDVAAIEDSQRALHEAFAAIVARLPQIQSVLLVRRDGHPLVSAGVYPVPEQADVSRHDWFKAVLAGYQGTYVSSLQTGEVNRQVFFGVARPWIGLDHEMLGVIDVAVSPAFFRDFYQIVVGEGGEIEAGKIMTLLRDDGQLLVRYPDLPVPPPRAALSEPFFKALAVNPDAGLYESRSIVDRGAPERLYAYRKVQGYPLYVVAGRNYSAIFAEWQATMVSHMIFGVPATLALCAIAWTALERAKREDQALARAQSEIRRRETAEDALLRAQRLEAVGQMTGGVAHDFNNLLTVILGSAELLARRADNPARVRHIAEQITLAARRGGEVTQQLLSFSRRQFVNPQVIDLNARLREFKQLLDRAASEAVIVTLDLEEPLDPVRLDPGHFEAAILNLVGNARDAMPHGGEIVISTRNAVLMPPELLELPPGGYVRVAVADTGTGMDEAVAAKAFEPFFTTKEFGRGTGLGLSQVYGFAKQAGGDVRIKTAPGSGTTIILLLPCADHDGEDGLVRTAHAAPRQAERGEVVLVVEDEPGVRDTVVESLADLGYTTLTAATAEGALLQLRSPRRIDLLFSDMMMPGGMNGLQLAIEARRLRPGLRVLLTSGYSPAFDHHPPHDVPLLPKPYDREQLANRMRMVLHG